MNNFESLRRTGKPLKARIKVRLKVANEANYRPSMRFAHNSYDQHWWIVAKGQKRRQKKYRTSWALLVLVIRPFGVLPFSTYLLPPLLPLKTLKYNGGPINRCVYAGTTAISTKTYTYVRVCVIRYRKTHLRAACLWLFGCRLSWATRSALSARDDDWSRCGRHRQELVEVCP